MIDAPEPDDEQESDHPSDTLPGQSAVDAGANRKLRNRKKAAQREADDFWRGVFDSPVGRREMWGLVAGPNGAHAFDTQFACGPNGAPQGEATWLRLGEQLFGQRLYQTWLLRYPDGVRAMHLECDPRFQPAKGN